MSVLFPGVVLALLSGPAAAAADDDGRPPVFHAMGFEEATAAAVQVPGGLLVLDAMTSWCGPCKMMDRTTWRDPDLVLWLRNHAVAIQLDMDKHVALKQSLEIGAFPTIVVFRGGEELDRVVGSRDAAFMQAWFSGLAEGRVRKETVAAAWAAAKKRGDLSVEDRLDLVLELIEVGLTEEASAGCIALWGERESWPVRMREGGFYSLYYGSMELAREDASMRQSMIEIADQMAPGAAPRWDAPWLSEWIAVERGLGRSDVVAGVARAAAKEELGRAMLTRGGRPLFDLLIDEGAWAEAGHSLANPVAAVDRLAGWRDADPSKGAIMAMPMVTAETAGFSMDEIRDRDAEAQGSRMFAALLAAEREALAAEVASTLLMHIDRPRARIALVARAMDAGHFDPVRDRGWLEEALLARPAPVEAEQAASSGSGMTPAIRVGG